MILKLLDCWIAGLLSWVGQLFQNVRHGNCKGLLVQQSGNQAIRQFSHFCFTFHVLESLVRVDYFLKLSRIVKRRPLANEMCDKKLVAINGAVVKAGREVAVGDILSVQFPSRTVKVRIEQVPERAVSKSDSTSLYTLLEDVQRPEAKW